MKMKMKKQGRVDHLVLVPCPLQGHMNPMLHLATILHSKGFSVTIVHTQFKSPNRSGYPPDIKFESISDGLSEGQEADLVSLFLELNRNCEAPFRDCLLRLQSNNPQDAILCIIHDVSMYFTLAIANDLKLPRFAFRTNSMAFYIGYFLTMQNDCDHPIKDQELEEPIIELPFLRIKDLPEIKSSDMHIQVLRMADATRTATGVIWNSFKQFELNALPMIQQDLSVPVFFVGPLHKYSLAPTIISSLVPDQSCITWLNTQAPRSVIYISFGSIVTISGSELVEMAWALANSKQHFLWVIRPSSVHGSKWVELLPKEFEKRTCGRGRIVKWAPQQEVLAHHAIGGFWTHSGWNSTIESITEGVPMLCSPRFGDQRINARLVSCVWRAGIQLDNGLEGGLIEKSIRRIMVDKEGMDMREKAIDLKGKIELSLSKSGSSYVSLEKLIEFVRCR